MLGFTTPWILTALLLLPVIWWLLRVTPPNPAIVRFPAIRLLQDLIPQEETPARTPVWLLLLRLLLAGLLVVALAGPVLRPNAAPAGRGPVVIVFDNGWAAAENWSTIKNALAAEIDRDERANRPVVLVPTAAPASGDPLDAIGPLPAAEARRRIEAFEPLPWRTDREAAAGLLSRFDGRSPALWLSDGVDGPGAAALAKALAGFTAPTVRIPEVAALPRLVLPPEATADLTVKIVAAPGAPHRPASLVARGTDGRLLGEATTDGANGAVAEARFDLPAALRNQITRIDLVGAKGVAGTVLVDERWRRRTVAIVAQPGDEPDELLSGVYYLQRALEPFADVRTGSLAELMQAPPSVLIVTDSVSLGSVDRRTVANWVSKGGVLLRFGGPRLAASDPAISDPLLPTALRTGGRSLSGALAWTTPAPLAPFPETSPFAGLDVPKDVTVSRQILAEPALDLDKKVWARLADGTPLITAARQEQGTLVLVHTTASPDWSNLALSGLFPEMLRRIIDYSAGVARPAPGGTVEPYRLLDGFARLVAPFGAAGAVPAGSVGVVEPSPARPPGFYGDAQSRRALNLTATTTELNPLTALPTGLARQDYRAPGETPLAPALLAMSLGLACIDTILALWLGGILRAPGVRRAATAVGALLAVTLFAAGLFTTGAKAADTPPTDPDARAEWAAAQVTLGYIVTGDPATDRTSRAGLEGLAEQLVVRTSIDDAKVADVDPERDELSVYPLLYWPITASARPLSDKAKDRLNRYLATGGMVLIDTRSGDQSAGPDVSRLIEGLDIPALVPLPPNHVLTKSFYLLSEFPGRLPGGDVWVERDADVHNDGVSSVIVGSADWSGAWAFDPGPGAWHQREWAFRFGVNLVMYALTGNYKADLVHAPFIHERLGQ